ncbi:MAG: TIGR02444 family protein [Kiloniellales bacterium]|nr:TIGR02444 family protein [Kiloniellales bacterium]
MGAADAAFWDYSLALYGQPGVAEACLALQDRLDLDVNLLLFCCWAGQRGRSLTSAEIAGLRAASRDWQVHVVRPLRQVRRWLKNRDLGLGDAPEILRREIKAQELEAERLEQDHLGQTLPVGAAAPSPPAAVDNLALYLAQQGVEAAAEDEGYLMILLRGAFPHSTAGEMDALARRLLHRGGRAER